MKTGKLMFSQNIFKRMSVLNLSRGSRAKLLKKVIINFSLCYIFMNFGIKYVKSENVLQCGKESFWRRSRNEIELNNLEKRAGAFQHNANEPIEDRYSAVELRNFKGYYLSVLDGHGGHQLAEFANGRLYRYFDNFYLELKSSKTQFTEDELVVNALYKTFEKVEKEFYEISIENYKKGQGILATVGSCVTIILVSPTKIYAAQLGDSKAKLYRKNKDREYDIIKLTNTHNSEKKREQEILYKEFTDKDIVVCKRPNNKVCYVKGRLQPTRVNSFFNF